MKCTRIFPHDCITLFYVCRAWINEVNLVVVTVEINVDKFVKMGQTITVNLLQMHKYEGKKYLQRRRLIPFPQSKKRSPGKVNIIFHVLPKGKLILLHYYIMAETK